MFMKKLLFRLGLSGALAAVAGPVFAAAPKITPDKTIYDFGKVTGVESVAGKFQFKNTGTAPLTFEAPRVSCGCTAASVTPNKIDPGQTAEMSFTLSLGKTRSKLSKHITVLSNDPETPELQLTLQADYVPLYEIQPPSFNLTLRQGGETNVTARLTRTDGKELDALKAESSNPRLKAELRPAGAGAADLVLHYKAEDKTARIADSVRLTAGGTNTPVTVVNIFGRVTGDILVEPESILWNVTSTNGMASETFTTRRLAARPAVAGQTFELHDASSSLKEVTAEVRKTERGYELVAKLNSLPPQTTSGKITVRTSLASQPQIEVPVTVIAPRLSPPRAAVTLPVVK